VRARLTGRPAAPGIALAPAFSVGPAPSTTTAVPECRSSTAADEKKRLADALSLAERELILLAGRVAEATGESEGAIFEAHAEFAADPELRSMAEGAIDDGASAERATITAFDTFRGLLTGSVSGYLAARAEDLDDVRDRVVAILMGVDPSVAAPDEPSIVVAHELSPSQTASIPREVIAGIAVETGSPTSHAAILARSLGIPAVVACVGLLDAVAEGMPVAVDGGHGIVLVEPSDDERAAIAGRLRLEDDRRAELAALRDQPGGTADGRRVELAANIGSTDDLDLAVDAGAEGSGLVRTEFLFLDRRTTPTIDDQVGFYTDVLRAFPGHRVVFRTMDIGADKPLAFVEREPEANPALGLRGIRLSLERPELLRSQLVALLRAREATASEGAGRLAIMFPLVSKASELVAARQLIEEVAHGEGIDLGGVEVGAMIEVPSAALAASRIAEHADFLSIGTNDLLQYLFAADRVNSAVGDLADVCEPEVLGLIRDVIAAGHEHGAWVGVCGEAASDPTVAAALVGLGIDELSMSRIAIGEVKHTLRGLTSQDCRTAVDRAIAHAADGTQARTILERELGLEAPPWAGEGL
jgi:phosphoenolpyruvate-protein phosphotransferase